MQELCVSCCVARQQVLAEHHAYCDCVSVLVFVLLCCAQDPSDKRFAMCNDTLKHLTGEKRIQLFGSQKYFKKHLLG
jgi:hypothetical protein